MSSPSSKMRPGSRALVVNAAILLIAVPADSGTAGSPELPEHWEVYRVSADTVSYLRFNVTHNGATVYGVGYYGSTSTGASFSWLSRGHAHAGVDADSAGHQVEALSTDGLARLGYYLHEPGVHDVLIIWTGRISSVEHYLDGQGTYALVAQGPAQSYTGHELDGLVMADAGVLGVNAHAAGSRNLEFSINHHLIGWFLAMPAFTGQSIASATLTSATTTDRCAGNFYNVPRELLQDDEWSHCGFREMEGPHARGPGNYRFDWTGIGGGYGDVPIIAWADVPWPPQT